MRDLCGDDRLRGVFGRIGVEDASQLASRGLQNASDLGRRSLDEADELATDAGRATAAWPGRRTAFSSRTFVWPRIPPTSFQLVVFLGVLGDDLGGRRQDPCRIGDGDRAGEQGVALFADRAVERLLDQGVLHHPWNVPSSLRRRGAPVQSFPQRSCPNSGSRRQRRRRRRRFSATRSTPAFERGPLRSPPQLQRPDHSGSQMRVTSGIAPARELHQPVQGEVSRASHPEKEEIAWSCPSPDLPTARKGSSSIMALVTPHPAVHKQVFAGRTRRRRGGV